MATTPNDLSRVIYSVRAKSEGERIACSITRMAFLRCIVADERTRLLFAAWGELTGIDAVTAEMSALLDAAALRAGLPHRSAFLTNDSADNFIPKSQLAALKAKGDQLLADTLQRRWREAQGFVVAELYGTLVDEEVPIRGWLAADLLQVFQTEVNGHVTGESSIRIGVPISPATIHVLPKGQRPKGQGEHLERNAMWNYRARVKLPKATHAELAREYREQSEVALQPKDDAVGQVERADTKLVREGIDSAQRLLELTVPPDEWAAHFAKFWPDRGGKTLN